MGSPVSVDPVLTLLADLMFAGIKLVPDGDSIWFRPAAAMTPDLAERVREHKPRLLAALVAGRLAEMVTSPDDLAPPWREEYEERAGIMEFEGNMTRERAEALALADVLRRMALQRATA